MELCGRALYNLLKITSLEDPLLQIKPWQVEDYRVLSLEQLFKRLMDLGVVLDEQSLLAYAEQCDSPEELLECVWVDESALDQQDCCYLLLFELWRRLLPEKQSLSVFCDELDLYIELYDQGLLPNEEPLQLLLKDLENLLDEAADHGEDPEEIFINISKYCAHDLEGFLYDYILDQLQNDHAIYASELLDACYDYVSEKKGFDLLKSWLVAQGDVEELNQIATGLLKDLLDAPDLHLLMEIAKFLVHRGDVRLFIQAIAQALGLLKTEDDFQEVIKLFIEYYRCLDKELEERYMQEMIKKRSAYDLDQPLDTEDLDFKLICTACSRG